MSQPGGPGEAAVTVAKDDDDVFPEGDADDDENDDAETVIDVRTQSSQKQNNPPKNSKSSKVCRFYKQGSCKHGLRGKDCKYDHPVACKKLLKHGNRTPDGCTLGPKCSSYHPKMCASSLKKKECFSANCKLVHVSGTKRKKEVSGEKPKSHENTTNEKSKPAEKPPQQNPFLEALQAMKQDIMRELDQRLASLQPKSYMSLSHTENQTKNQPQKQPPTIAWQQIPQAPSGGQVLGTQMPAQGTLQGQQVLLVPMQLPQ